MRINIDIWLPIGRAAIGVSDIKSIEIEKPDNFLDHNAALRAYDLQFWLKDPSSVSGREQFSFSIYPIQIDRRQLPKALTKDGFYIVYKSLCDIILNKKMAVLYLSKNHAQFEWLPFLAACVLDGFSIKFKNCTEKQFLAGE